MFFGSPGDQGCSKEFRFFFLSKEHPSPQEFLVWFESKGFFHPETSAKAGSEEILFPASTVCADPKVHTQEDLYPTKEEVLYSPKACADSKTQDTLHPKKELLHSKDKEDKSRVYIQKAKKTERHSLGHALTQETQEQGGNKGLEMEIPKVSEQTEKLFHPQVFRKSLNLTKAW